MCTSSAECRASRLREFDTRDLDLPSPLNPVCARGRELGADQAVEQLSLAAMQQHERLGVALRAAGEGAVVLAIERH